ncbi:MAG: HEPN domain-containing protein [Calditrichaeota bacterium]|nr:HEPN domain-containing protein [Calditrichota bacterium]
MKSQYKNLTTNQIVKKWLLKARYDLDTASAMLSTGRYFYVMFCCQQALRSALKRCILKSITNFRRAFTL